MKKEEEKCVVIFCIIFTFLQDHQSLVSTVMYAYHCNPCISISVSWPLKNYRLNIGKAKNRIEKSISKYEDWHLLPEASSFLFFTPFLAFQDSSWKCIIIICFCTLGKKTVDKIGTYYKGHLGKLLSQPVGSWNPGKASNCCEQSPVIMIWSVKIEKKKRQIVFLSVGLDSVTVSLFVHVKKCHM